MIDPVMDDRQAEGFALEQVPAPSGPGYLILAFGFLFGCLLLAVSAGVAIDLFGRHH